MHRSAAKDHILTHRIPPPSKGWSSMAQEQHLPPSRRACAPMSERLFHLACRTQGSSAQLVACRSVAGRRPQPTWRAAPHDSLGSLAYARSERASFLDQMDHLHAKVTREKLRVGAQEFEHLAMRRALTQSCPRLMSRPTHPTSPADRAPTHRAPSVTVGRSPAPL